jgi:hypothetical protein
MAGNEANENSFASNIMKIGFLGESKVVITNMKSELGGRPPNLI